MHTHARALAFAACAVSVGFPGGVIAQVRVAGGVGAGGAYVWRLAEPGPGAGRGAVALWGASAHLWRFELDVRYLQGRLDGGSDGTDVDLVEGSALLGLRLVPWAAVQVGPHIRSYGTAAATERWLLWEGRVALGARLVGPALTTYLDMWRVFGGNVNVGLPMDAGQGIEGGLTLRLQSLPLWGQVGYRAERMGFGGGSRTETVEAVFVVVGIGRSRAGPVR
jgi:hypothetical protein